MGPLPAGLNRFTLKKQMVCFHNAIHSLCINHWLTIPFRLPSQHCPHMAVAIRRQVSDRRVYPEQHLTVVKMGLSSAILPARWPINPDT